MGNLDVNGFYNWFHFLFYFFWYEFWMYICIIFYLVILAAHIIKVLRATKNIRVKGKISKQKKLTISAEKLQISEQKNY